jgi:hypothetical protein
MTRRHVLWLIAANLAVLLAVVIRYPHLMLSPGSLGTGHAALNGDCFACHEPWRGAVAARCTTCHVLADIGLRTTEGEPIASGRLKRGFHDLLIEQDCATCHTAHRVPLPTRRSPESFSHARLRPDARADCASCHVAPTDQMHRTADTDCSQCHAADRWLPASFEHDDFFVLDRRHDKACDICHVGNDHSTYTCYGCHAHTERRIRNEHLEEGIRDFEDCAACHPDAREEHARRPSRTPPDVD